MCYTMGWIMLDGSVGCVSGKWSLRKLEFISGMDVMKMFPAWKFC